MLASNESKANPTVAELVSALLLNGEDTCAKVGKKLAAEAVAIMVTHVNSFAQDGVVSGSMRSEGQLIDHALFQQAWRLLETKQETSPENALAAVGVSRANSTRFMEDME